MPAKNKGQETTGFIVDKTETECYDKKVQNRTIWQVNAYDRSI